MANKVKLSIELDAGDSVKTLDTMTNELDQLKQELQSVEVGSDAFKSMANDIRKAESELKDLEKTFEGLDSEAAAGEFSAFAAGVTDAFAGLVIAAGSSEEEFEKTFAALQKGIAISVGIKGAIDAVAKAQKAWNLVTKVTNTLWSKNPIGLITVAVVALTAAVWKLYDAYDDTVDVSKKLVDAQKEIKEAYEDELAAVLAIDAQIDAGNLSQEERLRLATQLKEKLGDLVGPIDELASSETKLKEAVDAGSTALLQRVAIRVYEEKLTEVTRKIIDQQEAVDKATDAYMNYEESISDAAASIELGATAEDAAFDRMKKQEGILKNLQTEQKAFAVKINETAANLKLLTTVTGETVDQSNVYLNVIKQLEGAFDVNAEALGKGTLGIAQLGAELKELGLLTNNFFTPQFEQGVIEKLEAAAIQVAVLQHRIEEIDLSKLNEEEQTKAFTKLNEELTAQVINLNNLTKAYDLYRKTVAKTTKDLEALLNASIVNAEKLQDLKDAFIETDDTAEKLNETLKTLGGDTIPEKIDTIGGLVTTLDSLNSALDNFRNADEAFLDARLNGIDAMFDASQSALERTYEEAINRQGISAAERDKIEEQYTLQAEQNERDRTKALEKEEEKRKAILKRGAETQFAISAGQIIANGSQAISKALAELGPVLGPIAAAGIGVSIAAQLQAANAEKAKVQSLALGGIVNGPSHEAGGVKYRLGGNVTELEGGEGVINKKSMAIPGVAAKASQLNQLGGGVPFANVSNGSTGLGMDISMVKAIVKEVSAIPVVVSEQDITKTQRVVKTIQERSTF